MEIREFADKFQLTYPVGQEGGIAEVLGANGIPETFFIGRDGRIIRKIATTAHYAELTAGIEEILK